MAPNFGAANFFAGEDEAAHHRARRQLDEQGRGQGLHHEPAKRALVELLEGIDPEDAQEIAEAASATDAALFPAGLGSNHQALTMAA
ncbi:hypothetical protein VTH06DRAFT_6275 [Thermothelomyces fergusii]